MKTTMMAVLLFSWPLWAQTFVATFVVVKGDVKVLRSPAGPGDKGPFAIYEGQKFSYEKARIGRKVRPGEIVQSGTDGKAKVVYPNGDHFLIGAGTSLVLPDISEGSEDKKSSSIKLIYGRVRSFISKTGPRNNLKVKTPSAVAGVRGTDFFTRAHPVEGTQITVLRGAVALESASSSTPAVEIKSGYKVEVTPKSAKPPVVAEASKQELLTLQSESAAKMSDEDVAKLNATTKNEIQTLAEASKAAVLNDIRSEDERLYNELKDKKDVDVDEINTAVVAQLYLMAPGDKKKKPTQEEVEAIGKDVYQKYFDPRNSKK